MECTGSTPLNHKKNKKKYPLFNSKEATRNTIADAHATENTIEIQIHVHMCKFYCGDSSPPLEEQSEWARAQEVDVVVHAECFVF